jgi:prepilin-type N-terminal cleavage/methylation domain-containing protein
MTLIQRYRNTRPRGFTLVELALVVGIVALLLGGLMVPLSRSLEQKAVATTQARLEAAQQALLGYALLNGRLPCPDTGSAGVAGATTPTITPTTPATTNVCAGWSDTTGATLNPPALPGPPVRVGASWGHLPWAELGIDGVDGWGNRLDYAVYTPLVDGSVFMSSVTDSNLVVKCTHMTFDEVTGGLGIPGCLTSATPPSFPALPVVTPSLNASFVVYSHGRNGLGAIRPDGSANPLPATTDEKQNLPTTFPPHTPALEASADDRRTFVFRAQTDTKSSAGEFDDLMVWMPSTLLAAKLLAAGKWP